jgi:hypothetical protein
MPGLGESSAVFEGDDSFVVALALQESIALVG